MVVAQKAFIQSPPHEKKRVLFLGDHHAKPKKNDANTKTVKRNNSNNSKRRTNPVRDLRNPVLDTRTNMKPKPQELIQDPVYFQVGFLLTKPHKKQREILRSTAKHKVICAGRRAGKSRMIAGEIVRGAMLNLYNSQVLISPTYKQTKIVYDEILMRLKKGELLDDLKKTVEAPHPKLVFVNDTFVDFFSADNPKSIRGFKYDRIFIDEAAFIKEEAWRAIRPLTFDIGAPIWQISTPLGKDQFYRDYQQGLKGDPSIQSFHFTSFDNPHIDEATVNKEVEEYGRNSVYVQTEIFANFVEDIDLMFPADLVKACTAQYNFVEDAT